MSGEIVGRVVKVPTPDIEEPSGEIVLYRFSGKGNSWHASDPQTSSKAGKYARRMASDKGCAVRLVRLSPAKPKMPESIAALLKFTGERADYICSLNGSVVVRQDAIELLNLISAVRRDYD